MTTNSGGGRTSCLVLGFILAVGGVDYSWRLVVRDVVYYVFDLVVKVGGEVVRPGDVLDDWPNVGLRLDKSRPGLNQNIKVKASTYYYITADFLLYHI